MGIICVVFFLFFFFFYLFFFLIQKSSAAAKKKQQKSCLFACVEVLWPSQPNEVMSSAVSLPNHTFTGQA